MSLKRSARPDTKILESLCELEQVFFEAFAFFTCLMGDFDFLACGLQVLCVLIEISDLLHDNFCMLDDGTES